MPSFEKSQQENLPPEPPSSLEDEAPVERAVDERKSTPGALIALAKSKFSKLVLGAAVLIGAEHAAAADSKKQEALPQKIEAKMKDGKGVTFIAGAPVEKSKKIGGKPMTYLVDYEYVSVHEEGNPSTDADDREIEAIVQLVKWEDGRETYSSEVNFKNGGLKNPFAKIEYHPDFEKEEIAGKPKEAWGSELEGIGNEYWAVKGFEAADKGDTPKAKHLRAELQKNLIEFQKKHPEAPVDKDARADVMGLK